MRLPLTDWFPILRWGRTYDRPLLAADLTASGVVTLLLIPQSLAYAMLAGMPPVTGLYASIVPMVVYALMGSSTVLGPGPSALRSIMSFATVATVVSAGGADFIAASAVLAVMVGLALLVMGALRMGFMASFLSQPVLSGFITASGLLIGMSQLRHVLGMPLSGDDVPSFARSLATHFGEVHALTLAVGLGALAALWAARRWLKPLLRRLGVPAVAADLAGKASPLLVILLSIALTTALGWPQHGLAVVGDIPQGLPSLVLAPLLELPMSTVRALMVPALLIAVMTFIEQISIAQGMAAKRRERIDVNAEMRAMGGANLAAGLTGAFAVGASFSRTSVVAESGGRTPAAGIITAVLLAFTALFLTPWLHDLPMAVLAATILISLGSLIDFRSFPLNWRYARADFAAQALTFSVTLLVDLVTGLTVGVIASLALHIWRSSRPHIAVVGNVPGTEHYRNVQRHEVSPPGGAPRGAAVHRGQRDRRQRTGEPAQHPPATDGCRRAAAPERGQGPGDGPSAAQRLPAAAVRSRVPHAPPGDHRAGPADAGPGRADLRARAAAPGFSLCGAAAARAWAARSARRRPSSGA